MFSQNTFQIQIKIEIYSLTHTHTHSYERSFYDNYFNKKYFRTEAFDQAILIHA